ncbi:MAG TPA: M66 family metalloprotease, partial [Labilithrix sp.]|nr:M66 family metalloprotease [Labilithrix sp.]
MRTIGSNTGLTALALVALLGGAAACSGGTTIYKTVPAEAPPEETPTPGEPATDPSTEGDPTSKDTPAPPLAKGLAITEIAFFQGVKVPVVTAGKAVGKAARNAPVVTGRPALVRVYVSPGEGFAPGVVTAELRLVDGTTRLPALKDTKTINSDSTDETLASTFNFEIPAETLSAGLSYQVLLTAKGGEVPKGAVGARFPTDGGVQAIEDEPSGKLKIVVVPVQYDADGSGRLPDVSAAQLALYKQTFMARYATTDVEITARAPWSYPSTVSANGNGFSALLNAVTNLRKSDGAAADVYYYGAFAPRSSFNTYCGGGCVTGLSTVVESAKTAFLRASVGVGFAGEDAANTAAHEVGHAHGREHAPCGGASGTDPDFPYSGGTIGVWGYNILDKTFLSPTKGKDMMGYCPNEWVSDYTFKALFDRVAAVNGRAVSAGTGGNAQAPSAPSKGSPQTYRMAMLDADGSVAWGGDIELDEEPTSSH